MLPTELEAQSSSQRMHKPVLGEINIGTCKCKTNRSSLDSNFILAWLKTCSWLMTWDELESRELVLELGFSIWYHDDNMLNLNF